jgi:hypothetical protein
MTRDDAWDKLLSNFNEFEKAVINDFTQIDWVMGIKCHITTFTNGNYSSFDDYEGPDTIDKNYSNDVGNFDDNVKTAQEYMQQLYEKASKLKNVCYTSSEDI